MSKGKKWEKEHNVLPVCIHCKQEQQKKWQEDNKDTIIKPGDFVQCAFSQIIDGKEIVEHMWIEVTVINDNLIMGLLSNDPIEITNVKCDDIVKIDRTQIQNHIKNVKKNNFSSN